MFTIDIPTILKSLRPGEHWCVRGEQKDYANLEWLDVTAAPTEQAMLDAELAAAKSDRIAMVKTEAQTRILAAWPSWMQDNSAMALATGEVTYQATKAVTGATNAAPIVISCSSHGYKTGDKVTTAAIGGNAAANVSDNAITVVDANSFSLNGTTGDGAYTSGGTAKRQEALGCKNDIKAIRTASDTAEADINALSTVAAVVAFTW